MLHSDLLSETVQIAADQRVLILNSAGDPFVPTLIQHFATNIVLAEDSIATLHSLNSHKPRHVAFHEYTLHEPPATMDVAILNLLYQPGNAWVRYALQLGAYALKAGGVLYVIGAKERGILSVAKRMEAIFGNVETLTISKGHRVICSFQHEGGAADAQKEPVFLDLPAFAAGELDEGTRLLLESVQVYVTDEVLDIGCGAGLIGIALARQAHKGRVTMVDASLLAVATAQKRVEQNGLDNVTVLPSDGAQAVIARDQRFDLVVTNPPFHLGGLQTTATAERFIRESAKVLRPRGRLYLVANRFLKYEPTLLSCFKVVEEVGGNTRYKVLRALEPTNAKS